jgi:hypothetical protein
VPIKIIILPLTAQRKYFHPAIGYVHMHDHQPVCKLISLHNDAVLHDARDGRFRPIERCRTDLRLFDCIQLTEDDDTTPIN